MGNKKLAVNNKETSLSPKFVPTAPFPTGTLPKHGTKPPKEAFFEASAIPFQNGHSSDVQEDDVTPSAPPLELMDQVSGYETTSFDAVCIPPPDLVGDAMEGTGPTRATLSAIPPVTEQEARAALAGYVRKHCCWGQGAVRDMAISKITSTSAFHYELQTFTEKRETSWAFTPYGGGEIDGPRTGLAPRPWDIEAQPTELFRNEVKVLPVPHTCSVKQCHRCRGAGSLLCQECHGKGWTRCLSCHGDGWGSDSAGNKERCFFCQSSTHGRGRQDCLKCNAKGRVACPPCDSYGQIRCFISLTITWKANTSEHIVEKSSLPEELIREVSGQVVFEEEGSRLLPLNNFPESTINLASAQIVLEHNRQWPDQKILAQRQQVRMVPVSEVQYSWKRRQGQFYLYGYENRVYAPDYPQTCCWGCAIL